MTNPLTSPSNMPPSTPIPRMPDGSPVPRAKQEELRSKARLESLPPEEDMVTVEEREIQGGIYVGDVSTEPKSEPIVVVERGGVTEVIDPGHSIRDDRLADKLNAELGADAGVSVDNPLYDAAELGEPRVYANPARAEGEDGWGPADDKPVMDAQVDFTDEDHRPFRQEENNKFTEYKPAGVTLQGPGPDEQPRLETEAERQEREATAKPKPKPVAKKAPAKKGAPKTASTPFTYPDTGNAS